MRIYKYIRTKWLHLYFWITFLVSFVAFIFSKNIDFIQNDKSFLELIFSSLYCSLSLFLMGGINVGPPDNEVLWIRSILWICYLFAPLVSVSYFTSVIQKKLFDRVPKSISDHAAILGFGRSGALLYDFHRESKPDDNIIIVDKVFPPKKDEYSKDPSTWLIESDFLSMETLRSIQIEKSRQIYITTNIDFVNVICLSMLMDYFKNKKIPKIICQISDPFFRKDIKKLYSTKANMDNLIFYNGFKSASEYLLENYIEKNLKKEEQYLHVFLGYGNFAFCLHEVMMGTKNYASQPFIIVTKRKQDSIHNKWINVIESKISNNILNCELIISDIFSSDLWRTLHQKALTAGRKLVLYICTDDDMSNYQLAMILKKTQFNTFRDSLIFIRSFRPLSNSFISITESKLDECVQKHIIVLPIFEGLNKGFQKIFQQHRI